MSQQGVEWTGRWVADKIKTHDEIASVKLLSPQHIELERKQYPTIVAGTIAVARVDALTLNPLLIGEPPVSFVVNVPKEAYVAGDALRLADKHRVPIGGMRDLMRAVSLPDVSQYVSPEFRFVERALSQHTRVERYERCDDRRYLIIRHGLDDVTVVFLNDYELTADHVRTARSRYGLFRMLVLTNPNGSATSLAKSVAQSIGCRIYNKWAEFLGALNK